MDQDFAGKVAIVTGAASGIGAATARRLAASGAAVVVADFNHDGAEAIAAKIGGGARAWEIDLGDFDAIERMVDWTVKTFGRLDLAVNNAGIGGDSNGVVEYDPNTWRRVQAVNLDAIFGCMKYQIPAMIASGGAPSSIWPPPWGSSANGTTRPISPPNTRSSAPRNPRPWIIRIAASA
nr:SDR family NAD(P)-dependent oxidoreductase [Brevundimonas diminuta]